MTEHAKLDWNALQFLFGYGTEEELKQAEPLKIVDSAEGIVDFFA